MAAAAAVTSSAIVVVVVVVVVLISPATALSSKIIVPLALGVALVVVFESVFHAQPLPASTSVDCRGKLCCFARICFMSLWRNDSSDNFKILPSPLHHPHY